MEETVCDNLNLRASVRKLGLTRWLRVRRDYQQLGGSTTSSSSGKLAVMSVVMRERVTRVMSGGELGEMRWGGDRSRFSKLV